MKTTHVLRHMALVAPLIGSLSVGSAVAGQGGEARPVPPSAGRTATPQLAGLTPTSVAGVTPAPDYVVGPGDVLAVVFWREQDMSAEVVVRPDGRISIPLLNDIEVTGLTPDQVREKLTTAAQRYVQEPNVTVVVKQINSRRVFVTGQVAKPGPFPLTASMNVLQLISSAGGLLEYADQEHILVMRTEKGQQTIFKFNYGDVVRGKNLKQNVELKPDDTVIVP